MSKEKNKKIFLFGMGGHAKVLLSTLNELEIEICGFVVPDLNTDSNFSDNKVLIEKDFFQEYKPDSVQVLNAIGSMPGDNTRKKVNDKLRDMNYKIMTVIHPSAYISENVNIGEGVQIMAGSVIQAGTSIGIDTIINTSVAIDHDCKIGERCHLAPGTTLSGSVAIGDNCHIGTGTVITNNINIGPSSLIAAGSVIYKDINRDSKIIQRKTEI